VKTWAGNHKTLVVLGIGSEAELLRCRRWLTNHGIVFEAFVEPDLGNAMTAIAVHPGAPARMFRNFSLWRPMDVQAQAP
jgi:hypothetical protein